MADDHQREWQTELPTLVFFSELMAKGSEIDVLKNQSTMSTVKTITVYNKLL